MDDIAKQKYFVLWKNARAKTLQVILMSVYSESFFASFFCYCTAPSFFNDIKHCVLHLGVHRHFRPCRTFRKFDKVQNKTNLMIKFSELSYQR